MSSTLSQPSSIEMARTLLAGLISCGVRDVVYSPGSRSAPFAYALAEAEQAGLLRVHIRLDERNAAFVALGLSRSQMLCTEGNTATRPTPVAIIGTSGGAIAEYHAGIAEASHSELPLIILSADRPFEMRGVGASQTTDQADIFGPHCRETWDIPAGQEPDHKITALVSRAVACALGTLGTRPGPVQINVGLRDPLAPTQWPLPPRTHQDTPPVVMPSRPLPTPWEEVVDPTLKTVILAGDGAPLEAGIWAMEAQIPLLAEPSTNLSGCQAWIPCQQAFLQAASPLQKDIKQVIVAGRPTLSRPVSALLARCDIRIIVLEKHHEWVDVAGQADVIVPTLGMPCTAHSDAQWLPRWKEAATRVAQGLSKLLEGETPTLLSVADAAWRAQAGCLVLGASNTIRACDLIAHSPAASPVVSNRGLAGIDGTIATALGIAWGTQQPVRALMGDLTFFHDASSLSLTEGEPRPDLQIIVCDDSGGGIFDSLEYSADHLTPLYDRWFATTQQASIRDLARAYNAEYHRVEYMDDLHAILKRPIRGIQVLHIPVPRPTAQLAAAKGTLCGL